MKPALYGAEGDVEHVGDVAVREAVEVREDQDFAEVGGHLLDDLLNELGLFGFFELGGWRCDLVGEQVEEALSIIVITANLGVEWNFAFAGATSQVVAGFVGCDGEEPGLETPIGIKTLTGKVHLNEGVLDDIFG